MVMSFRQRAGSPGLQTCVLFPSASRCRPDKLRADGCDGVGSHLTRTVAVSVVGRAQLSSLNDSRPLLLRVQLDDQLFLHGQVDLLARRDRSDLRRHPFGVELEPLRHATSLDLFERVQDRRRLPAGLTHGDDVPRLDREGRDVDLAAVHREVPVPYQLARLGARRRQSEAVGDVVEPALEQLQERLAGDAARPLRLLEVAAELILQHPVDALDLLLLTQLHAVAGELLLPRLAVLTRGEVALLDRALLGVAALPLEEQLHALAAAQAADGSDVTSHLIQSSQLYLPERLGVVPHTRRRFVGRQPLCGIGVTSRIDFTSMPIVCSARMADSRPEPGPFTRTSTERTP